MKCYRNSFHYLSLAMQLFFVHIFHWLHLRNTLLHLLICFTASSNAFAGALIFPKTNFFMCKNFDGFWTKSIVLKCLRLLLFKGSGSCKIDPKGMNILYFCRCKTIIRHEHFFVNFFATTWFSYTSKMFLAIVWTFT